jgi:hypothetical protein
LSPSAACNSVAVSRNLSISHTADLSISITGNFSISIADRVCNAIAKLFGFPDRNTVC